jgi:hypothetical protein
MNEAQRMKLYKEAATYGTIIEDIRLEGPTRLMVIVYDNKRFSVCLFQGRVFALTIEG